MEELAERIKGSITDLNNDLWFPELTREIVNQEWHRLQRDSGLTPNNYGTGRALAGNVLAPRKVITSLKTLASDHPAISVEAVQTELIDSYSKAGISFYPAYAILDTTVLSCVEDAFTVLTQVPSLMATVGWLVRSLHLIKPIDNDCDVSFSEPNIPFSIFVSVPERRIANDTLRVAEAIVHESMHLQLTLVEEMVKLAADSSKTLFFSPWREEYRPTQSILHGLYVFRVIDRFLSTILSTREKDPEDLSYIEKRRDEIHDQMRMISDLQGCLDLTRLGSVFVRRLVGDAL